MERGLARAIQSRVGNFEYADSDPKESEAPEESYYDPTEVWSQESYDPWDEIMPTVFDTSPRDESMTR